MLRALAFLTILATPAIGQDKTFDFVGIDSIDARNGVTVNVIPGDEISVSAHARSGDVDQVVIRKFGSWLAINRSTRWFIFPFGRTDDIVVTVTLPELRNIKAFDTATATADGFAGDSLRAEAIEGGSVIVSDIDVEDAIVVASEGGTVTISGTCGTIEAEAMFRATITADELVCTDAAATARSGAALSLQATSRASTAAMGGGTINLIGNPQIVDYLPGMEPDPLDPEG